MGTEAAIDAESVEAGAQADDQVALLQTGDRGHWRLWRRCPECEWHCDEVHGEMEIDAFDEELDLGTRALSEVLKALEHENMQFVADTFSAALAADLITADDFR